MVGGEVWHQICRRLSFDVLCSKQQEEALFARILATKGYDKNVALLVVSYVES